MKYNCPEMRRGKSWIKRKTFLEIYCSVISSNRYKSKIKLLRRHDLYCQCRETVTQFEEKRNKKKESFKSHKKVSNKNHSKSYQTKTLKKNIQYAVYEKNTLKDPLKLFVFNSHKKKIKKIISTEYAKYLKSIQKHKMVNFLTVTVQNISQCTFIVLYQNVCV